MTLLSYNIFFVCFLLNNKLFFNNYDSVKVTFYAISISIQFIIFCNTNVLSNLNKQPPITL